MKTVILDAATLGNDIDLSAITKTGDTEVYQTTSAEQVKSRIADKEAVIINKVRLNASNLSGTIVKLICIAATGTDNVDIQYCREHGIAVCNVRGYSTSNVVQVTVSQVLTLATHFPEYTRWVKDGSYSSSGVANRLVPTYHELSGKLWGIVGYGSIGQSVSAVAEALGCRVLACRNDTSKGGPCVSIDEICKKCDIITVHVPLTDKTRHLINEERIAMMKKDVIIVNTARGAVCDESAVAKAIVDGRIGGFGSDVYSEEPFSENHPMYGIKDRDNVCLTPHMAWGAVEARERLVDEIAQNIIAFLNGVSRSRVD